MEDHDTKKARDRFAAMLDEVRAEANRKGVFSLEAIAEEMDEIIASALMLAPSRSPKDQE